MIGELAEQDGLILGFSMASTIGLMHVTPKVFHYQPKRIQIISDGLLTSEEGTVRYHLSHVNILSMLVIITHHL